MELNKQRDSFSHALSHIASHAGVTLLAVGIAFSLPILANYILFTWWPMVLEDSQLLLINEIIFAAVLVLLFNLLLKAREARRSHRMARLASLVHAGHDDSPMTRTAQRELLERISGTRDVSVMSVTGYDTFVSEKRNLRRIVDDCYELRVLLLNPYGPGALRRAQSLGGADAMLESYQREAAATVERLAGLVAAGKQVTLKFYDDAPYWNLIVTGEHVWVQYCHDGQELKAQPEYVLALNKDSSAHGLFPAFYVHFLNHWNDPRHPQYDFVSQQLVYRDVRGNEVKRVPFLPQVQGTDTLSCLRLAS
jgi:hypothetical protein